MSRAPAVPTHILAHFVLFLPAPFFASPSPTRAPFLVPFLSSSFGYSTILIAILASSNDSSFFFHRTPDDSLLILAAQNWSIFDPLFLQVLHLPSQVCDSLSSLPEKNLLPQGVAAVAYTCEELGYSMPPAPSLTSLLAGPSCSISYSIFITCRFFSFADNNINRHVPSRPGLRVPCSPARRKA